MTVIGNEIVEHYGLHKMLVSNSANMSNCHPLEVVCRGSETQPQVGQNLTYC